MTLYEITEEFQMIQNALENGDIEQEDYEEMISCMDFELESKIDGYCYVMKNIEATIVALKSENELLAKKKKQLEDRLDYLKTKIINELVKLNKNKVSGKIMGVKINKSDKAVVFNSAEFYEYAAKDKERYAKYVKTTTETKPILTAIKKDIKNGEKIPGVKLEDTRHLNLTVG